MNSNESTPPQQAEKLRIASIDAFRGFTVLAMVFVLQVAGYSDLPLTREWFGSPSVTTFHHAADAAGNTAGIGLTFTDLVAPFFVFIVGMVLPLSKRRRGSEWWRHVGARTGLLLALGVVYISLIFGLSYWWGILQAIGVAYFMGAALMLLPHWWRWAAVFAIATFHFIMSQTFFWWLHLGNPAVPFFTVANLQGDMLRPLTIHCTPWASISYGVITVIGTLLGESIISRPTRTIVTRSLLIGSTMCVVGYLLHRFDWPVYAMNKETVSTSYALFTSGVASFTFLLFYLIIDIAQFKKWAWPFMVFGSNALLGYFLQPIVRNFVDALGFRQYLAGHAGWTGMAYGLGWTALIWSALLWCNKRNFYWKI